METVRIDIDGPVATIALARPQVKNAFNDVVISELREAFAGLDASVRAVVLTGDGDTFCAGADLTWMQASVNLSEDENARDAAALAGLFRTIDATPRVVIGRIDGAALGGGVGLVACCDVAIATERASFGFSEVRLGLVPAVISPFVLRKLGASHARRYFITGERFDAGTAKRIGLVHEVVAPEELDATVERIVRAVKKNGPQAMAEAKQLVRQVQSRGPHEALEYAVQTIARLRTSEEGQEGLRAFLEKREAQWP